MRQRVMIGMALSCEPKLADRRRADHGPRTSPCRPRSSSCSRRSRSGPGAALILLTHDLGVVAEMVHNVIVMYAGEIVEQGTVEEVLLEPRMPYTMGLIESIPTVEKRGGRLSAIKGVVPSPFHLPPACRFEPRCPYRFDICPEIHPELYPAGGGRLARCHLHLAESAPRLAAAIEDHEQNIARRSGASPVPLTDGESHDHDHRDGRHGPVGRAGSAAARARHPQRSRAPAGDRRLRDRRARGRSCWAWSSAPRGALARCPCWPPSPSRLAVALVAIVRLTRTRQLWAFALAFGAAVAIALAAGYIVVTMGSRMSDCERDVLRPGRLRLPVRARRASRRGTSRAEGRGSTVSGSASSARRSPAPAHRRPACVGGRRRARLDAARSPRSNVHRRCRRGLRGRRYRLVTVVRHPDIEVIAPPAAAVAPAAQPLLTSRASRSTSDLRRPDATPDRQRVRRRRRGLRDHVGRDVQPRGRSRAAGKTTLGRTVIQLTPSTVVASSSTDTSWRTSIPTTCCAAARRCRSSSRTRSGRSTRGCRSPTSSARGCSPRA